MPRKSAESLSFAMYHVGAAPPEPPNDMDVASSALWREIAADRPADWFTPASLRLLRRYCRTCVTAEQWHDKLDMLDVGSEQSVIACKQIIALNASIGIMASKLRLSVQNDIDRRGGRLNERGLGANDEDRLLGGRAVPR